MIHRQFTFSSIPSPIRWLKSDPRPQHPNPSQKANMSSTITKPILIIGLGRFAPQQTIDHGDLMRKFQAEMDRVHAAGYEPTTLQLNPEDVPGSLEAVREKLGEQEFQAVVIGYGLRGMKEFTVLFEGLVNCVMELARARPETETEMLFTEKPDGVMEALGRL